MQYIIYIYTHTLKVSKGMKPFTWKERIKNK